MCTNNISNDFKAFQRGVRANRRPDAKAAHIHIARRARPDTVGIAFIDAEFRHQLGRVNRPKRKVERIKLRISGRAGRQGRAANPDDGLLRIGEVLEVDNRLIDWRHRGARLRREVPLNRVFQSAESL